MPYNSPAYPLDLAILYVFVGHFALELHYLAHADGR